MNTHPAHHKQNTPNLKKEWNCSPIRHTNCKRPPKIPTQTNQVVKEVYLVNQPETFENRSTDYNGVNVPVQVAANYTTKFMPDMDYSKLAAFAVVAGLIVFVLNKSYL